MPWIKKVEFAHRCDLPHPLFRIYYDTGSQWSCEECDAVWELDNKGEFRVLPKRLKESE